MESIINDLKYNQTKEVSLVIQDINTGQIVGITAIKKNEIIESIKTNSYGGFIIKEILFSKKYKPKIVKPKKGKGSFIRKKKK